MASAVIITPSPVAATTTAVALAPKKKRKAEAAAATAAAAAATPTPTPTTARLAVPTAAAAVAPLPPAPATNVPVASTNPAIVVTAPPPVADAAAAAAATAAPQVHGAPSVVSTHPKGSKDVKTDASAAPAPLFNMAEALGLATTRSYYANVKTDEFDPFNPEKNTYVYRYAKMASTKAKGDAAHRMMCCWPTGYEPNGSRPDEKTGLHYASLIPPEGTLSLSMVGYFGNYPPTNPAMKDVENANKMLAKDAGSVKHATGMDGFPHHVSLIDEKDPAKRNKHFVYCVDTLLPALERQATSAALLEPRVVCGPKSDVQALYPSKYTFDGVRLTFHSATDKENWSKQIDRMIVLGLPPGSNKKQSARTGSKPVKSDYDGTVRELHTETVFMSRPGTVKIDPSGAAAAYGRRKKHKPPVMVNEPATLLLAKEGYAPWPFPIEEVIPKKDGTGVTTKTLTEKQNPFRTADLTPSGEYVKVSAGTRQAAENTLVIAQINPNFYLNSVQNVVVGPSFGLVSLTCCGTASNRRPTYDRRTMVNAAEVNKDTQKAAETAAMLAEMKKQAAQFKSDIPEAEDDDDADDAGTGVPSVAALGGAGESDDDDGGGAPKTEHELKAAAVAAANVVTPVVSTHLHMSAAAIAASAAAATTSNAAAASTAVAEPPKKKHKKSKPAVAAPVATPAALSAAALAGDDSE